MSVELSVVVPVFNEQQALPELYRRVKAVMIELGVAHEIVFVNDGSVDRSWEIILSLSCADRGVKAIALSRNFGHQLAITAGLEASSGAAVVVMDADLQDPPETIPALYAKFLEGFDVAYAQRRTREGETWWKRATPTRRHASSKRCVPSTFVRKNRAGSSTARLLCDSAAKFTTASMRWSRSTCSASCPLPMSPWTNTAPRASQSARLGRLPAYVRAS